MTHDVSPIFLTDSAGAAAEAELWDAITEKNLADWEAEWMPELFKLLQHLHRSGVERRLWPQSRHWSWRDKLKAIEGLISQDCFSVVCEGMTQGLMITNTVSRARINEQSGQHLVYVNFVETAPWNRSELDSTQPMYGGIGSILIRAAVDLSKQEGFKGRIGLHSLPQSNSFYANVCRMADLGADSKHQNLRYFEFTPALAEAFLNRGAKQ